MIKKLHSSVKQVTKSDLPILTIFFASFFAFAFIADENVLENNTSFDEYIKAYAALNSSSGLIYFMQKITFFGSALFLFPAYSIIILYYIFKKNYFYAKGITLIGLGSLFLMILFKQIFKRNRPKLPNYEEAFGYSFPSGHTLSSFVFCCLLSYLIWQSNLKTAWKYLAVFFLVSLSITVGISRIILNVHFATDVIAGFCLAVIWLLTAYWFVKNMF